MKIYIVCYPVKRIPSWRDCTPEGCCRLRIQAGAEQRGGVGPSENTQEAELTKLEKRLDEMYKASVKQPGLPRDQFEILRKDYEDTKAIYIEKYKVYSELIESARKAGLTVEIKK